MHPGLPCFCIFRFSHKKARTEAQSFVYKEEVLNLPRFQNFSLGRWPHIQILSIASRTSW